MKKEKTLEVRVSNITVTVPYKISGGRLFEVYYNPESNYYSFGYECKNKARKLLTKKKVNG